MSDELAPVSLQMLHVHPYPHALCLKNTPPSGYALPAATFYTSRTLHVPVEEFPTQASTRPMPLMAIFFACYRPELAKPTARPISSADAATRLLTHSLNPLAHAGNGLDGAIRIALQVPCSDLFMADLPATCALVKSTLERLRQSPAH